jgi:hypothetical protein
LKFISLHKLLNIRKQKEKKSFTNHFQHCKLDVIHDKVIHRNLKLKNPTYNAFQHIGQQMWKFKIPCLTYKFDLAKQ